MLLCAGTAPRKFLAKKVEEMLSDYPHLNTLVDAIKASKQTIMSQAAYNEIIDLWLEQRRMEKSPQQVTDDNKKVAANHAETEAEVAGGSSLNPAGWKNDQTTTTQSTSPPSQAAAVEPVLDDILFKPAPRQTLTQHLSQQKPLIVERDNGRLGKLAELFAAFDINGDGFIQKSELKAVGDARTVWMRARCSRWVAAETAGLMSCFVQAHRSRQWTDAKNDGLMKEIDANQDGVISKVISHLSLAVWVCSLYRSVALLSECLN